MNIFSHKVFVVVFFTTISSLSLAKVNISEQSIVDNRVQGACDRKHDVEQDILRCITSSYEPSQKYKASHPHLKVYQVDFSGFGTAQTLTPKESGKTIIIELNGVFLYGSDIYNSENCCNKKVPVLILETITTKNKYISDCDICPTSKILSAYDLNNLSQPPAVIDLYGGFTNRTQFGPLVSHDLIYDQDSLVWDDRLAYFEILASFMSGNGAVKVFLQLQESTWIVNISKQ